jgi:hypothetical protein
VGLLARRLKRFSKGRGEWTEKTAPRSAVPRKRRFWRILGATLLLLFGLGVVARLLLPGFVRDYVNRTLDRNPSYAGTIGDVQIHLWRGAYSIHKVQISKTTGNVSVPFFSARQVDFSIQWRALRHRKIVGRVIMSEPVLNFVDGSADEDSQTGAGGPWLQIIRDLFPFRINSAIIDEGSVHFRAKKGPSGVDVHLTRVNATIDNLGNIRDETAPLVATVTASALAMNHARLDCKMTLDPFSYRPTFRMALRLIGLDVTTLNDLALAYGKFDFKRGWFDLVIETDSKEGQMTGYVKPLFRNLQVFSLTEDIKKDNVLEFFWQALIGGTTSLFKNFSRDQFGTRIPFTSDVTGGTNPDLLATIGNILRNAFLRAYLPKLENPEPAEGITFGPPEFSEHLSAGGAF